jgi:hypothetical protein
LLRKDHETAYDRFRRADQLVHAPTLTVGMARALVGLGRLVEAQEAYQRVIREGVQPGAPAAWQRALADASEELAQIQPKLAWLTVTVKGAEGARVTIDDAELPAAAVGVRRATDPGERLVRATADRYLPAERRLKLGEGAQESVELVLEPDPNAPPLEQPTTPAPAETTADANLETDTSSRAPAYVAFGVAGAGLIVGAVTGVMTLSAKSDLDDGCNPVSRCPPDQQDTLDRYRTMGTVSAVGFGVAAVGTGLGIALLLMNDGEERPAQSGVVPFVGIGTIGAVGRF